MSRYYLVFLAYKPLLRARNITSERFNMLTLLIICIQRNSEIRDAMGFPPALRQEASNYRILSPVSLCCTRITKCVLL